MSIIRYLFPKDPIQMKLPLAPRVISSPDGPLQERNTWKYELLKGYGITKTDADAQRLLVKYGNTPITEVILREKRKRRRRNRLKRAWDRLLSRW